MKKESMLLMGGFLAMLLLFLLSQGLAVETEREDYDEMTEIAAKCEAAFQLVREEKIARGLDVSNHESGMLGAEFTGITTTLGAHESKTTAANPNFSGVLYRYLKELDLSPGDRIAMNFSGSFPSLNIQTIIVAEAMGYEPVILSSLGASTFGATDPEMTYLDMEDLLAQKGLIRHRSIYYTPGGDNDLGANMDETIVSPIVERLATRGYQLVVEEEYEENLRRRLAVYEGTKALINVGGNYMSQTGNDLGYEMPYGYLRASESYNYEDRGLIGAFLSTNRDVIHLLNIKDIALEFGLPIAPEYPVVLGSGGVFMKRQQPRAVIWLMMAIFIGTILGIYYVEKKRVHKSIDQALEQEVMD